MLVTAALATYPMPATGGGRATTATSEGVMAIKDDVTGSFTRRMSLLVHDRWAVISGGLKENHLSHPAIRLRRLLLDVHEVQAGGGARLLASRAESRLGDRARRIIGEIEMPWFDLITGLPGGFDAGIHGTLELFGICGRWRRMPYHTLSDAEMEPLKAFYQKRGLVVRLIGVPAMKYIETFDDGPGGWYGWISNAAGPKPLEIRDGYAISRSPWWIDYNHAPPGAGYLHLLYMLNTTGKAGEHQREVDGDNRFVRDGYPTDFTQARMTLRLRGELEGQGRAAPAALPGGAGRHLLRLAADRTAVPRHARVERADRHQPPRSGAVDLPGFAARPNGLLRRDPAGDGAARREHRHPAGAASAGCRADGTARW